MAKQEFRVDTSREFVVTKNIRGVEITKPTGLMYVDVFFPDGTQKTCGYIGKELNGAFAPLTGMGQDLAEMIQAKINENAGNAAGTGPAAPKILPRDKRDE